MNAHEIITTDPNEQQRLDKWLNISCLFKTRAQATKACDNRSVKVNDDVCKPSKMIKIGDKITIKGKQGKYTNYTITGLAYKNVSAKDARNMYDKQELELTEEEKEMLAIYNNSSKKLQPKFKGRPTKKDRRKLDKLKKDPLSWY